MHKQPPDYSKRPPIGPASQMHTRIRTVYWWLLFMAVVIFLLSIWLVVDLLTIKEGGC